MLQEDSDFEVRIISPEATHTLRNEILDTFNRMNTSSFEGDDEPSAFHLGVFYQQGEEPICVATFLQSSSKVHPEKSAYQLRGMATDPNFQGQGAGSLLIQTAESMLRDRDIEILWADCRTVALAFYRKLGWQVFGEEFDKVGVPHYVMEYEL